MGILMVYIRTIANAWTKISFRIVPFFVLQLALLFRNTSSVY